MSAQGSLFRTDGGTGRRICPTCGAMWPASEAPLFPPAARATDPTTSHQAEAAVARSGQRAAICERVLAQLRRGEATCGELADLLELHCHVIGRRTSDLERLGLIEKSGKVRRWAKSGRWQSVWRARRSP